LEVSAAACTEIGTASCWQVYRNNPPCWATPQIWCNGIMTVRVGRMITAE